MEPLFSKGRLEDIGFHHPELLQGLNLNVSTEELLSAERAFTYADLYAMLESGYTVARLTPHMQLSFARMGERCAIGIGSSRMRRASLLSVPTVKL
jgi:hypothetical protein